MLIITGYIVQMNTVLSYKMMEEMFLKEEKINLLKNDEFVRLINSIVIGSGKREDDEDIDHMSNYC